MAVLTSMDFNSEDITAYVVTLRPNAGAAPVVEQSVDGRFYLDKWEAWEVCDMANKRAGGPVFCVAEIVVTIWAQFNTEEDINDPDYWS